MALLQFPGDLMQMFVSPLESVRYDLIIALTCKTLRRQIPRRFETNASIVAHSLETCNLILEWPRAQQPKTLYTDGCRYAAMSGKIHVMKRFYALGFVWDAETCVAAASSGHVETLEFLLDHGCEYSKKDIADAAARCGKLDVIKWCTVVFGETAWHRHTCAAAAEGGNLDILKWLHAHGAKWDVDMDPLFGWYSERTCVVAATWGHLDIIKWARENGCPWNPDTCSASAEEGRLDILMWAHENGCVWTEMTCERAAENGHIHILEYACKNQCPWDETTCSALASSGYLSYLQWARANGCPWDEKTALYAAACGHLDVLAWAIANGVPHNKRQIEKMLCDAP